MPAPSPSPARPSSASSSRSRSTAENWDRDILTVADVCELHELIDHFFSDWTRLKDADRKAQILSAARAVIAA